MTVIEMKLVADFLQQNMDICSPCRRDMRKYNGNIVIHNDTICLLNGQNEVLMSRKLNSNVLKAQIGTIVYKTNIFRGKDARWSPFEHDDAKNSKYIVGGVKKGIDFPKFASVVMSTLLLYGVFPTFIEFGKIYSLAYTQCVSEADAKIDFDKYLVGFDGEWKDIGKEIVYPDGAVIKNKVLRFTDKVWDNGHASNFTFNQFTTEMLFCRLFKAYGSIVRDPYHVLRMFTLTNFDSEYSIRKDYGGSDGNISECCIRAYTNSARAHYFGYKKVTERHRHLDDNRVELLIDVQHLSDLKVLSDETLIAIGNQIKNKKGAIVVHA